MQMHETHDPHLWLQYWFELPFHHPGGTSAEDAERRVGNAVKSTECERNGFPLKFGRLAVYDPATDRAVVIAHKVTTAPLAGRIWVGTVQQYHADWRID